MFTDRLFEGKYKILEILGSGGMSTVYLAQNVKLGTLWAIKEINRKTNPKIDLFIEPNILKKLNHPALPRIFDIVEEEENIYVIVDFIEGIALDKEIEKVQAFEEDIVIDWAKQLCEVLNYLHTFKPNPIIYRDMKPSNIILTKNGSVKLIDFGIAREYKLDSGNDTVYIGTRGYAAPEQYGNSQTNVTTDIYSLGITLAHLLSGTSPNDRAFESKVLDYSKKNNVNGFERIISKCIQLNSVDRYQSIQDLLYDIKIYENSKINQASKQNTNNSISNGKEASFNKVVSFKRLVLTVWGNSEFASELAYFVAKLTDFKVLLINLDFLTNGIANYMNLKEDKKRSVYEFGFNEVINEAQNNSLTVEMIMSAGIKKAELDNLYVLMSNFDINNHELYKNKSIDELISAAYKNFELTILVVNKSIYDPFTIKGFIKSDYIIAPIKGDIESIREYVNYAGYLCNLHDIMTEKVGYVAFEYKEKINLSVEEIKNEVGNENYLGKVGYNSKREIYRNLRACYSKRIDSLGSNEYKQILAQLNILPKLTFKERLNIWIYNSKRSFMKRKGKVIYH